MKIVLSINIYSEENATGLVYEKVYLAAVAPKTGDKVKDAFFAELKEVEDIIYDFSCNECYVILPKKLVPNDRLDGHIQEVAEIHNWIQRRGSLK